MLLCNGIVVERENNRLKHLNVAFKISRKFAVFPSQFLIIAGYRDREKQCLRIVLFKEIHLSARLFELRLHIGLIPHIVTDNVTVTAEGVNEVCDVLGVALDLFTDTLLHTAVDLHILIYNVNTERLAHRDRRTRHLGRCPTHFKKVEARVSAGLYRSSRDIVSVFLF